MAYYDKLKYRQYQAKKVRSCVQSQILNEMHETNANRSDLYNKEIFNKGMEWYYTGLAIDDADDEIKNNTNFIRGFELAVRQDKIRKGMKELGSQWFDSGNELEDAKPYYLNNKFFVKGYNDAKNNKKIRRL